jgi:hypothetical protein
VKARARDVRSRTIGNGPDGPQLRATPAQFANVTSAVQFKPGVATSVHLCSALFYKINKEEGVALPGRDRRSFLSNPLIL